LNKFAEKMLRPGKFTKSQIKEGICSEKLTKSSKNRKSSTQRKLLASIKNRKKSGKKSHGVDVVRSNPVVPKSKRPLIEDDDFIPHSKL
jgi:hypothetical protein